MRTLAELLTGREVVTMPGTATPLEAARAMNDHHVGAVLVVDDAGAPTGIFTERDLMKRVVVGGLAAGQVSVESVMTRELFTATASSPVTEIAQAMQDRHIRHLPVVDDDGKVLGLLGLRDLLREHLRQKTSEVEALTNYIQGPEVAER